MSNQETQTNETTEQILIESMNDMKIENEKLQKDLGSAKNQKRLIEGLYEILDTICDEYDVFEYDEDDPNIFISKDIIKLVRNMAHKGISK